MEKGCMYCKHLWHDEKLTEFECMKNSTLKLENAGAFMMASFGSEKMVIVENCPGFESKYESQSNPVRSGLTK